MTLDMRNAAAALTALLALTNIPLTGQSGYLVSGVVVDSRSHLPMGNATVSLAPVTTRDRKLERVTNRDGRFAFSVSQPGKYSLQITKPGYPPQLYKHSSFAGVASAIAVRDDQDTTHLVFEAVRGSAITGQIRDEDSEPVGDALVAVFQSLVIRGERKVVRRGSTRANAVGEFRLANLRPGNYYVCAMGRPWFADSVMEVHQRQQAALEFRRTLRAKNLVPDSQSDEQSAGSAQSELKYSPDPGFRGSAFLTAFYPDAQTIEEASPVRVDAGGEARISVTLRLARAALVKGTIQVPGAMTGGQAALNKRIYDQHMPFLSAWVNKDLNGAFEFPNVPAGSYEIVASSEGGSGASSWHIRQDIEVRGSDVEVVLRPLQMASLSGKVVIQDKDPASLADLFVLLRDDKGHLFRSGVTTDGSFSLNRILPGSYEMAVGPTGYIAAFMTNPAGQQLPLTVEIASGDTLERGLNVTRAAAVIDGTVAKAGQLRVGAFVLLMPKDPSSRWAYRVDQTDSDGSYHLGGLPAGDYLLVALTSGENVLYRDPKVAAALQKVAQSAHVDPGGHLNLDIDEIDTATLSLPSR